MKKIVFTPAARADVRRIDRDTAMRILTALDHFARTGEGDVKKLQGNTNDLRLRVGELPRPLHREPARHPLHSRRPAPLRSLPLNTSRPGPERRPDLARTTPDTVRAAFDFDSMMGREPAPLSRQA